MTRGVHCFVSTGDTALLGDLALPAGLVIAVVMSVVMSVVYSVNIQTVPPAHTTAGFFRAWLNAVIAT